MVKLQQEPTKPQRTPKAKHVTRGTATNNVIVAIDGKTTLGDLAAKVDAMVVEQGGKSNLKAAIRVCRLTLATAEAIGVVKLTRPTDLFVERVKK